MSCSKLSSGSSAESSVFENPNSSCSLAESSVLEDPNSGIIPEQSTDFNMQNNADILLDDLKVSVADIDTLATPGTKLDDGKHLIQNAVSDSNHLCQEFSQKLSLDLKKHFAKCKTFPASTDSQQSSVRGISSYSRSISLPSSCTLVPALKGGRALSGITVKSDLSVKWAPDVYDPPTTSMSHTLNSHNQRPKSKKKDKRKNKGKPSRKNAMEQKHGNRKGYNKAPDPLNVRMHGSSNGGNAKGVVDLYEYGFNNKNQEVKCGSSFLMESLQKVHLSIGEAS